MIRWEAIIWTSDGLAQWRIYTSLGPNELMSPICYIIRVTSYLQMCAAFTSKKTTKYPLRYSPVWKRGDLQELSTEFWLMVRPLNDI